MEFNKLRNEITKKYRNNKQQLKNKSAVPSVEELAKRELVKNEKFLKTIRASVIQRDDQLPSCLSPKFNSFLWNTVRIILCLACILYLCTVIDGLYRTAVIFTIIHCNTCTGNLTSTVALRDKPRFSFIKSCCHCTRYKWWHRRCC